MTKCLLLLVLSTSLLLHGCSHSHSGPVKGVAAPSFVDGGKSCSDKTDCSGFCLAPAFTAPGTRIAGTCQKSGDAAGCHTWVEKGVATVTQCD